MTAKEKKGEKAGAEDISERTGLVVATGGGVVLNYENVRILESTGTGICLKAPPEVIYNRVKNETHRPLLQVEDPLKRIHDMLESRKEAYSKVSHQLLLETDNLEENVERILDIVKKADQSSR